MTDMPRVLKNLVFFFAISAYTILAGEYVAFSRSSNGTNNITIPAGEIWKVVNWSAQQTYDDGIVPAGPKYWTIPWGSDPTRSPEMGKMGSNGTKGRVFSAENPGFLVGEIFEGPFTFVAGEAITEGTGNYYLVFKKIKSDIDSLPVVSSTAVVIPSNTTGDVDLKLEQSADQLTWTECQPGTYNSSTVKRFFRLRAVEK
jgi:hypothetical protein